MKKEPKTKKQYLVDLELDKSSDPTVAEIKTQYRKLSTRYHPDNKKTGNEERFKLITDARNALLNKEFSTEPINSPQDFFDNAQNKVNSFVDEMGTKIKIKDKSKLIYVKLSDNRIVSFDVSSLTKNKKIVVNGEILIFELVK